MRRFIATMSTAVLLLAPSSALAGSFGIQIGPHIDTKPGSGGCVGGAVSYCVGGKPGVSSAPGAPSTLSEVLAMRRLHRKRCRMLHDIYILRHPLFKPATLRGLNGCSLWSADYEFHAAVPRHHGGIGTTLIEAFNPNAN